MVGGAYCPLSSRDPLLRLSALVHQVRSRLVLVHPATRAIFGGDVTTVDIDTTINGDKARTESAFGQLSDIHVTLENIAIIIFTSGSTGVPKAVRRISPCSCTCAEMRFFGRSKCVTETSPSSCAHSCTPELCPRAML